MNILNIWHLRTFGDRDLRVQADAALGKLAKAVGAASAELSGFYDQLNDVVYACTYEHILFGDKYFRLRFAMTPVVLPADFKLWCAEIEGESGLFARPGEAERLAKAANSFYDFVANHNQVVLIRFLMYDNSVRKLLNTIDEVHLRQLATLVNGGIPGGSPLGMNALMEDFDNEVRAFTARKVEFGDLQVGLKGLRLARTL